jgi:hypothetical protein
MTIPFKAGATRRFTPPHYAEDDPARPVYLFRTPSVAESLSLTAELTERGLVLMQPQDLTDALRQAVRDQLVETDAEKALVFIDRVEAARTIDAPLTGEEAEAYNRLHETMIGWSSEYARKVAQAERLNARSPIVLLDFVLIGWENLKDDQGNAIAFKRTPRGLTDETQRAIPLRDLLALGTFAGSLFNLTGAQRKNSAPPSPLSEAPQVSTAD